MIFLSMRCYGTYPRKDTDTKSGLAALEVATVAGRGGVVPDLDLEDWDQ